MIDVHTKQPLRVSSDEIAGPYFMVPFEQVGPIRERLDRHAIQYWVDRQVVSIDGGPHIAWVNFGPNADRALIQAILDEAE